MKYQQEPIAIIGIGCRFPGGANSHKAFWRILTQGKDAIVPVPKDRWDSRRFYDPDPEKPGKVSVKQGGFLNEKIYDFDPLFFGISPREAETIDPQQRLLLEVTWEAFEDAGLRIEDLAGSKTGVFIGGFALDNLAVRFDRLNLELANTHTPASFSMTILSNRLSHVFDLKGPSITIDTACSASLVSTHYACQSLWNGESDLCVAGGVNVIFRPELNILMSKGKFLSHHGRCMTFDERAAGYTRGEGAGVVILKPLTRAIEDNDHIYSLIKMTGVNQDGYTPGISMPNGESQMSLMREVYGKANISPSEIGYIEAHGTGTQAGDPIEANAIHSVLKQDRKKDNEKCPVGSVKTNIGHLEAGAGIAGLIKTSLCIYEEVIPPNLHFNKPNPKIPFDEMCVRVPTETEEWPRGEQTRYAGVNSFGYGGTNAHALLQEAPVNIATSGLEEWNKPYLIPISARDENALRELAARYAFFLNSCKDEQAVRDFIYSITMRRSHHNHRLALLTESREDIRKQLQAFSTGEHVQHMSMEVCDTEDQAPLAFVYTGMGPQWWAMGRELMDSSPLFLETIQKCDKLFQEIAGWSIYAALKQDEANSQMSRTEVAQPANFVIQVALTALWEERGITPDAIIGHSVGEVSAAYVSGALSLEDAIKVSIYRSRLQATTAGNGAMLAIGLPENEALEIIKDYEHVSIGAINSPSGVTLSGDKEQLVQIASTLKKNEVFNRQLDVEVAYHSPQMDMIKDELLEALTTIAPHETQCPLYSTVSGQVISGEDLNAEYWWQNVREPVRFADGINALLEQDISNFLEVGPHPVLAHSIKEVAGLSNIKVNVISSLNRKFPESMQMLESLGRLYSLGYKPNWPSVAPPRGRFTNLPTYPWQRERYWTESPESHQERFGLDGHVFLNNKIAAPQPSWLVEINAQYFPYLQDHRVNNEVIFPGAAYVEAGLAVQQACLENDIAILSELKFESLLFVEEREIQQLSISYDETEQGFTVHSRVKKDEAEWQYHASGKIVTGKYQLKQNKLDIDSVQKKLKEKSHVDWMYEMLEGRALSYGPCFKNAQQLWKKDNEVLVLIEPTEYEAVNVEDYCLHPAVLDTAIHSMLAIVPGNTPLVPVSIDKVIFYQAPEESCWCHGLVTKRKESSFDADIYLYDEDGLALAELTGITYRKIETDTHHKLIDDYFYEQVWQEYPAPVANESGHAADFILFANNAPFSNAIEQYFSKEDISHIKVLEGTEYQRVNNHLFEIDPQDISQLESLLDAVKYNEAVHLFYTWPMLHGEAEPNTSIMINQCMRLLYLVQAISSREYTIVSLNIFTTNAQTFTNQQTTTNLNLSPLWGLGQLIENEYPHIRCKLFDLESETSVPELKERFSYFIDRQSGEFAFRDNKIFARQLISSPIKEKAPDEVRLVSTEQALALVQETPGQLDSIHYEKVDRIAPSENEIEIKVHYAGLNFKDVLKVYNTISPQVIEDTYFERSVGMEISGEVVQVGQGVKNFQIGNKVIAAVNGAFRSFVTVSDEYVILKPEHLSLQESLINIVYPTAYYALIEIARLRTGEKVLIHSATGGLGLAAIQIAKWKGAEIFATAGTDEKREYLRSIGIQHVMDSRSLNFAEEIREITKDYGVDIVLNALSGEALKASIELLAPYGRFLEVGKKDISENNSLSMAPFNHNLSFSAIDLDRMYAQKPSYIKYLTEQVVEAFNNKHFEALPVKVFDAAETADAFRYLAKAQHIGKVVVKLTQQQVPVKKDEVSKLFDPQGSYLITGGNGGFGLEVAKWLGDKNIGKLILVSRSGARSEEVKQIIKELNKKIHVESLPVDITQQEAVDKLISDIQSSDFPLKGVIHAATVYDDAFIKDLDEGRLSSVLLPKVAGALNLYACTKALELKFFVSFSSISSLVGNRGQANYIAANSFLDEFSRAMRTDKFPTSTINWGSLKESGIITRNANIEELLKQEGIVSLSNIEALHALEETLLMDTPQVGVFNMNWTRWSEVNIQSAKSIRYQQLLDSGQKKNEKDSNSNTSSQKIERLIRLTDEERSTYVEDVLIKEIAKVLKMTPDKINATQNLNKLGIDSFMLLELTLTIQLELGIEISSMELLKQRTLTELANNLISKVVN